MKARYYLRNANIPHLAVLFLFCLSIFSCGGSDDTDPSTGTTSDITPPIAAFSIGGSVQGLDGQLDLALDADDTIQTFTVLVDGSFTFSNTVTDGADYDVLIAQAPDSQTCSVASGSGTVNGSDVDSVAITCTNNEVIAPSFSQLSGTIFIAPNTQVDSDVNDLNTPAIDNSSFENAQSITNRSTVQGFVTSDPTGNFFDRFATIADVDDVYSVNLQTNQVIRLQVVDFDQFDTNTAFSGDLDLFLFDSDLNQIDFSNELGEFEEVTVPADGEYFIVVEAFSGASRYVLTLADAFGITASSQNSAANTLDFLPYEAIVQVGDDAELAINDLKAMSMSMSHNDASRAALASMDRGAISASIAKKKSAVMSELARENATNYDKFATLKMIKTMGLMPSIEVAEPNYIRYTQLVPNDQFFNLQWHYSAVNLPQAWNITTGAPETGQVIVAVVDTGVFLEHPDLSEKLVPGYDFIRDVGSALDGDGIDNNPDDPGDSATPGSSSWHGTHVSGTVGADSDNGIGGAGVSWEAQIMPMRALGLSGQGSSFDIIQAVLFAAGLPNDSGTVPGQRADIINLSLSGPGSSTFEQSVYQQVANSGVIVVAAAGNESTSTPSFPAAYDGVFSVAALDAANQLASYSNFGDTIDLAAPGGSLSADLTGEGQPDGVLSTLVDDSSGERRGTLNFYQGTSMASPHVAGIFALMKAVYPPLSPQDVEQLLQAGLLTQDLGAPGFDTSFGYGGADALLAVQAAQTLANGGVPPELPPAIIASPNNVSLGSTNDGVVSFSNAGGGSPAFVSAASDAPWLSVTALDVDADGLGEYLLSVDRTGLADGFYTTSVAFEFTSDFTVTVLVSMTVGDLDSNGVVAEIFLLLIEVDTFVVVEQIELSPVAGEALPYSFEDVPTGSYFIFAGTDVDNDFNICQPGEACGAYPSINDLITLEVSGDTLDNLDFVVDILDGFATVESSAVGVETEQPIPLIRAPSP